MGWAGRGCCWSGSPGGGRGGPRDLEGPEQPLSARFQFLLEMEGAAAGAELGLFRCLLCAWETPSRLAVLQHLRAPAHRDAQAQRRLQLLQSGPAAEDGLSALQSILSFSHGQLRTTGEEQGTARGREPGLGRRGCQGGETALCAGENRWKGASREGVIKADLGNSGAAQRRGKQEALGREEAEKGRGFAGWRVENRKGGEEASPSDSEW